MKRYHFLAVANFLASGGGGIVLVAGVMAPRGAIFKDTIFAFLAGSIIGLLLERALPPGWARPVAPWFSLSVGATSVILFWLLPHHDVGARLGNTAELLFIVLLSVRFGLSFFARSVRAEVAGTKGAGTEKQGIALAELGYYAGMALAILGWGRLGLSMGEALLADALLQGGTGLIDLFTLGRRRAAAEENETGQASVPPAVPALDAASVTPPAFDYGWYRRVAAAVACLTVGFQAVLFGLSTWVDKGQSPYLLGWFYVGLALAALTCRRLDLNFGWEAGDGYFTGNAAISSKRVFAGRNLNYGLIMLAAVVSMTAVVLLIGLSGTVTRLTLALVAVAAFIYQVPVLTLLGYIAKAACESKLDRMVMRTYLLVLLCTIFSFWALKSFPKHYAGGAALTLACATIAFLAVHRRGSTYA